MAEEKDRGEEASDLEKKLERLNRDIAAHHEELGRALQRARELRELIRRKRREAADSAGPANPPA